MRVSELALSARHCPVGLPKTRGTRNERDSPEIVDDEDRSSFKVHRMVSTDEAILELERNPIFSHCWLCAAGVSELPEPETFFACQTGGRELLLTRDGTGKINAYFDARSYRGR